MKVITTEKRPIKMWLEDIEDGALAQAKNLANLPFIHKHVAIMPDCHQGYGMPIGGAIATKGVIIPNAVGVDIGCGMCAVKTSLTEIDTETLKKIMGEIRKAIPVGFNKHKTNNVDKNSELIETANEYFSKSTNLDKIAYQERENAIISLGTLGGGNHFIEVQKGDDGHVWIMIHSGSRNLGLKVANHYNKLAIELNEKWYSSIPKEWELAHLPIDSEEGKAYIREMNYCVEFALANRKLMMNRVKECFMFGLGDNGIDFEQDSDIFPDKMINIAHNYASQESHFGKNVWIHRKGATLARKGTIGIIPGSQGTKSYIVKGKGNKESFDSCSHGAGRTMGRKEAERTLDLAKEQKILNDQGIIHSIRGMGDLDEAPSAYKDITKVMESQKDLVEILVELSPLAVIKG